MAAFWGGVGFGGVSPRRAGVVIIVQGNALGFNSFCTVRPGELSLKGLFFICITIMT